MDLALKDRVAVVTGASQGIGYACAAELLAEGAHVVVASRNPERNADACERLRAVGGGRVLGVPGDLNRSADVRTLFEKTIETFGQLDILVNAAALVAAQDFFDMSDESWSGMFDHKLNGTARCIREAVPLMRTRGWGRIINIAGTAARQPHVRTISVSLNNIAVVNLTKAVAKATARDGILVNAVVPGFTLSERNQRLLRREAGARGIAEEAVIGERGAAIPLGRPARPEEISPIVALLASERASFVTGSAWSVDGGVEAAL